MRQQLYPTKINLRELNHEGEDFHYSDRSGELNNSLKDLISNHSYQVDLHLKSVGNAFEISGKIDSTLDLVCSRCGRDLVYPVKDQFAELILVLDDKPRAGHSGHTGSSDQGPFCNYATSYTYDLAEFVHEHLVAAEPLTVYCDRPDCETHFSVASTSRNQPGTDLDPKSPFSALKNFTVKGQRS